jgi:NarL family two-component system response regulator LiaR
MKHKVIIADDHPIVLAGLEKIINESDNFTVAAKVTNGKDALQLIEKHQVPFAVLDLEMPIMNGKEVCEMLGNSCKIIIITMHNDEWLFNEVMDAGAYSFIPKDSALDEIIDCLNAALHNQDYIAKNLLAFFEKRHRITEQKKKQEELLNQLTKSEINILKLIAKGKTSLEIADILFISSKTVENHRYNICKKLNITGNNALVKFASDIKNILH